MALSQEQPPNEGVFMIVCLIVFMMLTTYVFASFVVWAHEQTAQECIQNSRIWKSDDCLPY